MLQVRADYQNPLTLNMLKKWHQTLMKFDKTVNEGVWRSSTEPMQIISGRLGKIEVHFEAPPSKDLQQLLTDFENWYQNFPYHEIGQVGRAMLRAALVHLYFETLHPFEDGNGRIGRALSEKALAETLEKTNFDKPVKKNRGKQSPLLRYPKTNSKKAKCCRVVAVFFYYSN